MSDFAICVRCSQRKSSYESTCAGCGMRPAAEGLLVAWLLSTHHLKAEQLERAAKRIADGTPLRPTEAMLTLAKKALGHHLSSDPGMSRGHRILLVFTSLILTPWVGWTLWFSWRRSRPRAAYQALALSLPASVLFSVLFLWRVSRADS